MTTKTGTQETKEKRHIFSTKENPRALEAFEVFYNLGEKRSLSAVHREMGVSMPTLISWRRKYHWDQRVRERNREFAAKLRDETFLRAATIRMNHIETIGSILDEFINEIERQRREARKNKTTPPLLIRNVSDLEKMIKLHLLLLGEPTERQANTVSEEDEQLDAVLRADPEARDMVREVYRRVHMVRG